MKKLLALIVMATLLVGTLTGCGTKDKTETGSGKFPGTPGKNEVTVNLTSEPGKLNTVLTTDVLGFNIERHIFEGLTATDAKGKVIPGVASSWDVSADGTVYTFHLRNDKKWSNGDPVTAQDFELAWRQVLEPATACEYNYLLFLVINAEEFNDGDASWNDVGIKALDDYTFEVKLLSAAAYFPSMCTFGVLNPVPVNVYNGDAYATEKDNMLFNGPYMITAWDHEDRIVLEKNPGYVGDMKPSIDKITWMMINDTNTGINAFENGEIDMVGITGQDVAKMKSEGAKTLQYSDGSSWVIAFNQTKPLLQNINLRKGLTLALDRESYIKDIRNDNSIPSEWWCTPDITQNGVVFADTLAKGRFKDHDVEGAKAAIELAKQELGVDEIRLELLTDEGDVARDIATLFQNNWEEVGIKIDIAQVPFKDRLARQTEKNYDLSIFGWGPDYDDPMTFMDLWISGGGNNIIGYSNPKYDDNIRKAITETNEEARLQLFTECEEMLADDWALGYIYFRMRDYVVSDKLDGVIRTALEDINLLYATSK